VASPWDALALPPGWRCNKNHDDELWPHRWRIFWNVPAEFESTVTADWLGAKNQDPNFGPMMMLFIVLARNKLRIPLEGTYSGEM
jgi:hypothetical protein